MSGMSPRVKVLGRRPVIGAIMGRMTAWRDVEQAEPGFAQRVRALFDAHRHKTIATPLRQWNRETLTLAMGGGTWTGDDASGWEFRPAPSSFIDVRALIVEIEDGDKKALKAYREAIELDPGCKPAYEAIGKLSLARQKLPRDVAETVFEFFEFAQKCLPGDAAIQDLVKKPRAFI